METRYHKESGSQIGFLFSGFCWKELSKEERLEVCQEVENRIAAQSGRRPRMVSCQEMEGQVLGFQRGKEVVLNEHLLREEGSVFQKTFYDKGGVLTTRQEVEEAAGWKMMELLFHIDAYHLLESKGIKATKENYMQALTDKDLHRIQPSEAKAYEVSFERTLAVIEQVETSAGVPDADAEKYRKYVKSNSYEKALERAKKRYLDENIEKTLQQVIEDRDAHIYRENMGNSYVALQAMYQKQDNRIMDMFEGITYSQKQQGEKTELLEGIEMPREKQKEMQTMFEDMEHGNEISVF